MLWSKPQVSQETPSQNSINHLFFSKPGELKTSSLFPCWCQGDTQNVKTWLEKMPSFNNFLFKLEINWKSMCLSIRLTGRVSGLMHTRLCLDPTVLIRLLVFCGVDGATVSTLQLVRESWIEYLMSSPLGFSQEWHGFTGFTGRGFNHAMRHLPLYGDHDIDCCVKSVPEDDSVVAASGTSFCIFQGKMPAAVIRV